MRRIAFLRSVEVERAVPYLGLIAPDLEAAGAVAGLFHTDGECAPGEFPGEARKIPADAPPGWIADTIEAWGADGCVSLSLPDENALRDAVVGELLTDRGIPAVTHSVRATALLANKHETRTAVSAAGLAVPPGLLMDGDLLAGRNLPVPAYRDVLRRRATGLGFPLLTKPLWDNLSSGIRFLPDATALDAYLQDPYDGNAVLEACLTGELCSVEIVGRDGEYLVQPLVWKGRTGGEPSFLFGQLRHCAPRPEREALFGPVGERLVALCRELDLNGAVEVEMIHADDAFHVIEINPRVSGSTAMSIAASECNTYACLLHMLLGDWTAYRTGLRTRRRRWSLEFPVGHVTPEFERAARAELDVVRVSNLVIDGRDHGGNLVLACAYGEEGRLLRGLERLESRFGTLGRAVVGQVADVVSRHCRTPAETAPATP
ncbi:ATP-grasp domain-containing protein [Streptomyces sp. ICBB 8177]|uniref:ATP-grasp domain-containing protein n=1 Tax=Streptomyces sp. ICBB 8177 TaxID=563922 RepID=UPI000D672E24|nr:ATP-grasp domain-containing protein [Streptomyces sp. ICBB 8177]PWI45730.1 hypothetical protein CK485_00695 [Streptomyces sp. ICBB 8177]